MLFNASQRRGVLVLLLLATSLIVIPRQFLHTTPDLFLLLDTVEIPQDSVKREQFAKQYPKITEKKRIIPTKILEINHADSIALVSIKGIGPYYARKIIQYRQQLGGYHSVAQLKELKMKYFELDSFASLFSVDPEAIMKKDLDSLSFKEMVRHPYLEYEDVRLIFEAKRRYQSVSLDVLTEKKVLAVHKLKRLKPYFK